MNCSELPHYLTKMKNMLAKHILSFYLKNKSFNPNILFGLLSKNIFKTERICNKFLQCTQQIICNIKNILLHKNSKAIFALKAFFNICTLF